MRLSSLGNVEVHLPKESSMDYWVKSFQSGTDCSGGAIVGVQVYMDRMFTRQHGSVLGEACDSWYWCG